MAGQQEEPNGDDLMGINWDAVGPNAGDADGQTGTLATQMTGTLATQIFPNLGRWRPTGPILLFSLTYFLKRIYVPSMAAETRHHPDGEDFLRRLTFPEEELRSLTTAPWNGERRWFRSANVVPMERYRSPDQVSHILSVLRQRRRSL